MFQRTVVPSSSESSRVLDCLTLELKARRSFETSGTPQPMTPCPSQETGVCSKYRSENLSSCKDFWISESHPKMWKPEEDFIMWHVLSCWIWPVTSRKQVLEVMLYNWSQWREVLLQVCWVSGSIHRQIRMEGSPETTLTSGRFGSFSLPML
jgi:hypothetical protein